MSDTEHITNPVKAIRAFCLDCCGGNSYEVRECTAREKCALYPFRLGKNPFRTKRQYTDEQKAELASRFAKTND